MIEVLKLFQEVSLKYWQRLQRYWPWFLRNYLLMEFPNYLILQPPFATVFRNLVIRITVVNILGQEIVELKNGWQDIGRYEVVWNGQSSNGRPMSSGVYFVMLSNGKTLKHTKLCL